MSRETHLYIASIGDQCEAMVYPTGEPERCLEPRTSVVHHTVDSASETVVMALPTFDGFATGERPTIDSLECPGCGVQKGIASAGCPAAWHPRSSFDAPAEDGGEGGSWAYVGPLAVAAELKVGTGAWARAALESADVLESGPWPVRQWRAPDGGEPAAWERPGELIRALNVAGEAFEVQVYWSDPRTRLVRIAWGSLAYAEVEELYAAVETWPDGE